MFDAVAARLDAQAGAGSKTRCDGRPYFSTATARSIEEAGYLDRLERLVFFPYSVDAVRLLNRADFAVVVVTNQAGIARGIVQGVVRRRGAPPYRRAARRRRRARRRVLLLSASSGGGHRAVPADRATAASRSRACCAQAAAEPRTSTLDQSFVIGDRWHDLEAGQRVGARGVLVRTGYGKTEEAAPQARRHAGGDRRQPDRRRVLDPSRAC